jgi:hypothetical protein
MRCAVVSGIARYVAILAVSFIGCGGGSGAGSSGAGAEAGYIDIEPVTFALRQGTKALNLTSSPARLWYAYQPADADPGNQPVFVFFNGGPGCATSDGLFALNTARRTTDRTRNGDRAVGRDPSRWSALGHLLYIDARLTGFSYDLADDAADEDARRREFDAQNFNPYVDAADTVRMVLRFLAAHPALQARPIVLVAESYGGERATLMLHMLLEHARYAAGDELYRDDALSAEIAAHLRAVFPGRGEDVSPETVAQQFGRQVLIEPLLSGNDQFRVAAALWESPASVIDGIAAATHTTFTRCAEQPPTAACDPFANALQYVDTTAGRDVYAYSKPRNWMARRFAGAGDVLQRVQALSLLTGVDVAAIPELYASERDQAYRVIAGDEPPSDLRDPHLMRRVRPGEALRRRAEGAMHPGDLADTFGMLHAWDRYFVGCSDEVNEAFYANAAVRAGFPVDPLDDRIGGLFLHNAALVETFVTDAATDLVIYAPALPGALAMHDELVASVAYDADAPAGTARPGELVLTYRPEALTDVAMRAVVRVRFPHYERSGHAVALFQPAALRADVAEWLGR